MALLDPDHALREILDKSEALPSEEVSIQDALGRYTTEDVFARRSQPSADNSAMDGYALRAEDVAGASSETPVSLRVAGRIRAGDAPDVEVGPGQAIRIFTGALIPPGATAVVMQEQTDFQPGADVQSPTVSVMSSPRVGQNIRREGEEYRPGDLLFPKGSRIREASIGLLAGDGTTRVPVHGRPRVAVIGTGDELVAPEAADDRPQAVIDGNSPMLAAAAGALDADLLWIERVGDQAEVVADSLRRACPHAHVVLTTGGASVGEFDVIPEAWEMAGIQTLFWKVAIKPGKPLRFGVFTRADGGQTLVFALPGNPLSALTNFELFVHPALRKLSGASPTRAPSLRLPLARAMRGTKDRRWLVRAAFGEDSEGKGSTIEVPLRQGSNMLREAAVHPLVAQIPPYRPQLSPGAMLDASVPARDLEGWVLQPVGPSPVAVGVQGGNEAQQRAVVGLLARALAHHDLTMGLIRWNAPESTVEEAHDLSEVVSVVEVRGSADQELALFRWLQAFADTVDIVLVQGAVFSFLPQLHLAPRIEENADHAAEVSSVDDGWSLRVSPDVPSIRSVDLEALDLVVRGLQRRAERE